MISYKHVVLVLFILAVSCVCGENPGTMTPSEKLRLAGIVKKNYGTPAQGEPGAAVDGLTLAAGAASRPNAGECVTLWLKLENVSKEPVYIYQNFWGLYLQPKHMTGTDHPRCVSCSAASAKLMDFAGLQPGESIIYLMDADPIPQARGADTVNAYLDIPTPDIARNLLKGKPGRIFGTSGVEVVSGPITIHYSKKQKTVNEYETKLINAFHQKIEGAEKELAEAPFAYSAVKREMRSPDEIKRWSIFQFLCRNPRPDMADEAVDFLARWGPRSRDGKLLDDPSAGATPQLIKARLSEMITAYGKALHEKPRLEFFYQTGLAIPYDYREAGTVVSDYTISSDPAKLACAARVFILFCERGDTRPEVWEYAAKQMFTNPVQDIYNPKEAERYARKAVALDHGNTKYRFMLHTICGETAEIKKLIANCSDPMTLNHYSWTLSTLPAPGKDRADLAVRSAEKAVKIINSSYKYFILDTMASAYAAQKRYAKAVATQMESIRILPEKANQRHEYFERLVLYILQEKYPEGKRLLRLQDIERDQSKDILIQRLKNTSEGGELQMQLARIIKYLYPNDPLVLKAIKDIEFQKPEEETKPAEQEVF